MRTRIKLGLLIASCFSFTSGVMVFGEDPVEENRLIGDWGRSGELGYTVELNLAEDHTYTAQWTGCAVSDGGRIPYGIASGTWELDGSIVTIKPEKETEDVRGDLEDLEVRKNEGHLTLWPAHRVPRVWREFGSTGAMSFERNDAFEEKLRSEEGKPLEIPDDDRGPATRLCTMEPWPPNGKLAKQPIPKAQFTIPKDWCVAPGYEDWPAIRDTWTIVPEFLFNDRPYPEVDLEVVLEQLGAKAARTQKARAEWYRDVFRKGDSPAGKMRLLGSVKSIPTKRFGLTQIYHLRSENGDEDWIAYLFGKGSVVEVHLTDRAVCGGEKLLDAVESIVQSVSLREDGMNP